jgi:PiT family inorganic phosphate transporter
MEHWIQQLGEHLTLTSGAFLLLAVGLALSFEFVNGFHDTANAVATVIYTHSLKPVPAVIWSGLWNLIGVLTSTGTVAFSVVALLPAELVLNVGSGAGFAMVFALLISAICWNLGTWYLGLPASSSHTLIGSIMGVGVANSLLSSGAEFGEGVNWAKTQEVFVSLLTSPLIGFVGAALLLLLTKTLLPQPALYEEPEGEEPPPIWIRGLLILTCTGVSFAHGSNDGQKGMGLIMLILVGILPGLYALNLNLAPVTMEQLAVASEAIVTTLDSLPTQRLNVELGVEESERELSQFLKTTGEITENTLTAISLKQKEISKTLNQTTILEELSLSEKIRLRNDLYLVSASLNKLRQLHQLPDSINAKIQSYRRSLNPLTQFIPVWVKVAVAVALGIGTMVGWKRIVVTVGEKIGKDHLTYAQGASAELVAMSTIFAADQVGLPVSTTHVLASGIAGTMTANGSGIQANTVRNILLAWVLTLPACLLLGGITFTAGVLLLRWLKVA